MTKQLIIGTTNPAKIGQLASVLAPLGIEAVGMEKGSVPTVVEDGTTVQENARKKATAYARVLGKTVLSMDNALFFDDLSPERQPGIHVRRIGGTLAVNDAELLAHGVALVESLGGTATGYWEFGVCVAAPDGTTSELTIRTPQRTFTSTPSATVIPGYPLESIQVDPASGKYISEMTEEEQADFWKKTIGVTLATFVQGVL